MDAARAFTNAELLHKERVISLKAYSQPAASNKERQATISVYNILYTYKNLVEMYSAFLPTSAVEKFPNS